MSVAEPERALKTFEEAVTRNAAMAVITGVIWSVLGVFGLLALLFEFLDMHSFPSKEQAVGGFVVFLYCGAAPWGLLCGGLGLMGRRVWFWPVMACPMIASFAVWGLALAHDVAIAGSGEVALLVPQVRSMAYDGASDFILRWIIVIAVGVFLGLHCAWLTSGELVSYWMEVRAGVQSGGTRSAR